jgi:hypothetical protein
MISATYTPPQAKICDASLPQLIGDNELRTRAAEICQAGPQPLFEVLKKLNAGTSLSFVSRRFMPPGRGRCTFPPPYGPPKVASVAGNPESQQFCFHRGRPMQRAPPRIADRLDNNILSLKPKL